MKFNEFMQKNPTYWEDNFPSLPASVTAIIEDWFYYRDLCSDNKFPVFFRAKMKTKLDEFLTLYNKELAFRELDPFQIEKIERSIKTVRNNTVKDVLASLRKFASTQTETRDLTDLNTRALQDKEITSMTNLDTKDLTTTETRNLSSSLAQTGTESIDVTDTFNTTEAKTGKDSNSTTTTGTTTTANTGTTTTVDTGSTTGSNKFSDYPQSDVSLTDYLTNQNNASEEHTNNVAVENDTQTTVTTNNTTISETTYDSSIKKTGSNTRAQELTRDLNNAETETGTVVTKQEGTDNVASSGDRTLNQTGTDENTHTGTVSNTNNSSGDLNQTNDKTENGNIDILYTQLKTGNLVEQYEKFYNVVSNFNAVDWLLRQLDPCFIQVFDEDEDDSNTSDDIETKIAILQKEIENLNSRVTELEEGGTGGGVSKDYVDKQIAAVNKDVDALYDLNEASDNAIKELSNETTEIGTDLQETNLVVQDNTKRIKALEDGGAGGTDITLSKAALVYIPNITIQEASVPVTFDNQNVFSVVQSGNVVQIFTDSFVLNAQTDVTDADIINSAINTYFATTFTNAQFNIIKLVQPAAFKETKLVCSLKVDSVTVYKRLSCRIMYGILSILSVEDATASDMNTNTLVYSYTKEA